MSERPDRALDPQEVREFISRNRIWLAAHKATYWTRRRQEVGTAAAFVAAEALRARQRALDPAWPRPSDRAADLAHHVRLATLLRRAAPR